MKQKILIFLATGFGSGFSPFAPGTAGTIVAIPFVWLLAMTGPWNYMFLTLLSIPAAMYLAQWYEHHSGSHDSKQIVVDEFVGFFITMTWIPLTWQSMLLGFVLFRFLDAVKPFPISYLDRNVKGGVGVVVDDIAAGLVANIALQVIYSETAWLGVRLVE